MRRALLWFVALLWALVPGVAHAHSMYQSSVLLDVHRGALDLELQMPPTRLSQAVGTPVTQESLPQMQQALAAYLAQHLACSGRSGARWTLQADGPLHWTDVDGAPYVVTRFHILLPTDAAARQFTLTDHVITETLPSHTVLVSVRSDWAAGVFANEPDLVGVIDGEQPQLAIDLGTGSWTRGFGSIFHLGTRHIAEGTDHLLFLLALLLPAPLGWAARRWAQPISVQHSLLRIVRIATAFTVGHSVTLALASLGILHVPERPIEVLIAFSILLSAVHAIRPLFPGRESMIAAGFGLIHGMAFASTLAELGLRGWERAEGILAFNLGIEAMQLLVIACVLPSLLLLSRTRAYPAFRVVVAGLAAVAAAGWMMERISDRTLGIDRAVDLLAGNAVPVAVLFFGLALLAALVQWQRRSTT